MRAKAAFIIAVTAIALSGCATITSGTSQDVRVETEPTGASCKMQRAGAVVGIVQSTPGVVRLGKSKDDVTVFCSKPEHEEAIAPLASGFQGMTIGNVLLGGFIGLAIDAGSGAINEYPDFVFLVLPPKAFASNAERDAFYDRLADRVRDDADKGIKDIRDRCQDPGTCESNVKKIEAARDSQLSDLDAKRLNARVAVTG